MSTRTAATSAAVRVLDEAADAPAPACTPNTAAFNLGASLPGAPISRRAQHAHRAFPRWRDVKPR